MRTGYVVVLLVVLLITGCAATEQNIEDSYWEGVVSIGDTRFFIYLRAEGNQLFVSFPEMLAADVPVEDLRITDDQWSFKVSLGTSTFRFLLNSVDQGFDGKILYDQKSGSIMLRPGRNTVEHRRMTRPEQLGEEVSIATPRGTLYGTLDIPDGSGPFPTVLIVAGSGPTDRDGNSELLVDNNDNLWHIARALNEAGIATLRYDKMGVGESQPINEESMEHLLFEDYVDDAVRWLRFLAEKEEAAQIGILGHSEGSTIALLAAKAYPVDFVVSVAGNGDRIDEQMVKQVSRMDDEASVILKRRLEEIARSEYRETGNLLVDSLVPLGKESYLQSWMRHDPSEVLRSLDVPTLVVWGDRDERLVSDNDLFDQKGMPETVSFAEIHNMGHMLRYAEDDADLIRSYKDRAMPLHADFVKTVIDYIHTH